MTDSHQCSQHPWCITVRLIEYNIVCSRAISVVVRFSSTYGLYITVRLWSMAIGAADKVPEYSRVWSPFWRTLTNISRDWKNLLKCTSRHHSQGAVFIIYITWNTAYIYDTGQSCMQQTMFTGHHDYLVDDFMWDAATITDWLILACKSIPVCQEEPSNEPYRHSQHCQDLPDTMCECDIWVHGMYHKFVRDHFSIGQHNVMFSSALLLHVTGRAHLHGNVVGSLPTAHSVLMKILRRKHPCNPTVGKITQEFVNFAIFANKIQPREEDILWHELHSVTFPVGTVSNQSHGVSPKEFNNIWHTYEDPSSKSNWNCRNDHGQEKFQFGMVWSSGETHFQDD